MSLRAAALAFWRRSNLPLQQTKLTFKRLYRHGDASSGRRPPRKDIVFSGGGFLIFIHMKNIRLYKWIPALLTMAVIYWFSSQPSNELPNFDWADKAVKKSGHVIEYAILAIWLLYALGMAGNRRWLAWLLAFLYAITDEFHQAFVPGRFPSVWDVLIFDNFGALIGLWFANGFMKQKRPG